MSLLKGLSARARSLFASRAAEARMEEEFRFHLAMEAERLVASGFQPDEARRRARVAGCHAPDSARCQGECSNRARGTPFTPLAPVGVSTS